jgi:hypothetical protein
MTEDNSHPATPPVPGTIAGVLDLIRREREAFEAVLTGLDATALMAVDPPDAWSIKDHLMHLVAWEEVLLGTLAEEAEHLTLGLEESVASTINVDDLNALFYRRNRDLPLPTVLERFASVHQKVLAAVARLSDEDLAKPGQPDDPELTRCVDKIRWNTYEHYLEHRGWLGIKPT